MVGDPVERRRREHGVDRRPARAGSGAPRSATTYVTRSPNRASRSRAMAIIDGDPSSAITRPSRQPLQQVLGDPTRPAAGVEHRLVAAQRQPVKDVGTPAGHRIGDPVVGGAVPVPRRRRSSAKRGRLGNGRRPRPGRRARRGQVGGQSSWSLRPPSSSTAQTRAASRIASTDATIAADTTTAAVPGAGAFSGWTARASPGPSASNPGTAPERSRRRRPTPARR